MPSTAAPSQNARSTAAPAVHGGANGNLAPQGTPDGRVNLDGSSSGGGGAPNSPGGASAPLNLDLHGNGAGPMASRSRSGLLPMLPAPPDDKAKMAKDIEKATRPDCKDAYAEHGLLAVVPLAADTASGKGCKW